MARAAFALVSTTALNACSGSTNAIVSVRSSGASTTAWPRARKACAVRSPSGSGRVTSRRTPHTGAKKFAPARCLSSLPASAPSATASATAPARAASTTSLPSGLAIRPRNASAPARTVA